jgi:general nucleoside transport system ATP-binding protein
VTAALELRDISKRFGSVHALRGADFVLSEGELHALLGENGAGKSTLMRIAFGLIQPDGGEIRVHGTRQRLRSPRDARRLGLGMVHQHFTSVPALTVAENIALGAGWPVSPARLALRVRELAARYELPIEPGVRVGALPAGLKQRVEVLKALASDARILLLDEPSSVLSPAESDALLGRVGNFREAGLSSVFITHKLDEALRVADRVTVLRRGEVVFSGEASARSVRELAALMLGDADWSPSRRRASRDPGEIRVKADRLAVARAGSSGSELREATFRVRAGEIVGVAAIEGNGQRELLRAVGGLIRPASGTVEAAGPVAFVPEDRSSEALVESFTLAENLVLSQGADAPWVRGPWLGWPGAVRRCQELITAFGVVASGPAALASSLSGGNQQRMVIAAALERDPAVLVAENPTRGLDLKATDEVQRRLREAADSGVAVLVHSSDLDEVLELADRVMVVSQGVAIELPPETSRSEIGELMLAGGRAGPGPAGRN